jgi:hypothetical protein
MKKVSTCILVGFSLITLTSSVFAQSTALQSWEETAAKRSGEYFKLAAQ